jgi:hypothetical protein
LKLTQQQINSSQDSHFGIPFGGYKQSGIGRELGQYALSAYTQVKAVHGKFAFPLVITCSQLEANTNPQSIWEPGCRDCARSQVYDFHAVTFQFLPL